MAFYLASQKRAKDFPDFEQYKIEMIGGKSDIWADEIQSLQNIVFYLADSTDDIDAHKTENDINALGMTIEDDLDNVMEKLFDRKAKMFCNKMNDTPLIRAVSFRALKCLKLLLTDYRDRLSGVIDTKFGDLYGMTAAHMLFTDVKGGQYKWMYIITPENRPLIQEFIPLFRKAGANFDVPDNYGVSINKILHDYNLRL
jgi:hypothetical protein